MPVTQKYEPLLPGLTYHIYNRTNGNEKMFIEDANYQYFLQKLQLYISPIADIYCYCLMPTHFHFLLRIKSMEVIETYFHGLRALRARARGARKNLHGYKNHGDLHAGAGAPASHVNDIDAAASSIRLPPLKIHQQTSKAFSNFFNSYTKSLNKVYKRHGNLFSQNFKRKLVIDEIYMKNLVHYIHYNPLEGKLCQELNAWPYSSYRGYFNIANRFLTCDEIIKLFGGIDNFRLIHGSLPGLTTEDFL